MAGPFVKVTETSGVVRWINLDHVRQLAVKAGKPGKPTLTEIQIDSSWASQAFHVIETPEAILAQVAR